MPFNETLNETKKGLKSMKCNLQDAKPTPQCRKEYAENIDITVFIKHRKPRLLNEINWHILIAILYSP